MDIIGACIFTILLPFVAFMSNIGRGFMTVVMAQIAAAIGWGGWFPWSIPALFSGVVGPHEEYLGAHSYIIVILASLIGLVATFTW